KWKCLNCQENYCEECKIKHDEEFKNHKTIISQVPPDDYLCHIQNCPNENKSPFEFFCEDCQLSFCSKCSDFHRELNQKHKSRREREPKPEKKEKEKAPEEEKKAEQAEI
ncbi:MAG: hypothetical protein MJ252_31120, partial [archaeon]|nr:hypothetical protein [archaeon]